MKLYDLPAHTHFQGLDGSGICGCVDIYRSFIYSFFNCFNCVLFANNSCAVRNKVNTSGEESKHGVDPLGAVPLARHIAQTCTGLRLAGLMTIGMLDYTSRPENFQQLEECREAVARCVRFWLGLHSSICTTVSEPPFSYTL